AAVLSRRLSRLPHRPRRRAHRDDQARRARDVGDLADNDPVVLGHRAQLLRRRRRRASQRRPLLHALRMAVGALGLAAARRRNRSGVPRGDRRGARPAGEDVGNRGAADEAALAVPLRRDVLDRGDRGPARHAPPAVRVGRPGGAAPAAGAVGSRDAAVICGVGGDSMTTQTIAGGPTPALMKEINAAFNSRDVDRIMTFFAEDATFLMARGPEPDGRRVRGKAAIRKVLADRFKVITDMRWDHIDAFICGDRAVSVWMVTGTGTDGERLNYRGCDIYEFRGDKILNKDTYWKQVEQK